MIVPAHNFSSDQVTPKNPEKKVMRKVFPTMDQIQSHFSKDSYEKYCHSFQKTNPDQREKLNKTTIEKYSKLNDTTNEELIPYFKKKSTPPEMDESQLSAIAKRQIDLNYSFNLKQQVPRREVSKRDQALDKKSKLTFKGEIKESREAAVNVEQK